MSNDSRETRLVTVELRVLVSSLLLGGLATEVVHFAWEELLKSTSPDFWTWARFLVLMTTNIRFFIGNQVFLSRKALTRASTNLWTLTLFVAAFQQLWLMQSARYLGSVPGSQQHPFWNDLSLFLLFDVIYFSLVNLGVRSHLSWYLDEDWTWVKINAISIMLVLPATDMLHGKNYFEWLHIESSVLTFIQEVLLVLFMLFSIGAMWWDVRYSWTNSGLHSSTTDEDEMMRDRITSSLNANWSSSRVPTASCYFISEKESPIFADARSSFSGSDEDAAVLCLRELRTRFPNTHQLPRGILYCSSAPSAEALGLISAMKIPEVVVFDTRTNEDNLKKLKGIRYSGKHRKPTIRPVGCELCREIYRRA